MVDVSVIIVNYNTKELLRECLQSVVQDPVPKEIIVVDNASSDGSAAMVEEGFPRVFLIRNTANERFAKPNNTAMRRAQGRYYFLLNSDARLLPMALEKLVEYLDKHPDVGMCGPQLLYPDGRVQPSCRGFVSLWTHFCDMTALDRLFPRSRLFAASEMEFFDHRSEREVDHCMAAAVLVRSETVRTVGMFDEELSIYYNDLDWSHRIHQAGWKITFYPSAQVVHHLGSTARQLIKNKEIFQEQYRNILYYYRKHFGQGTVLAYRILLFLGFLPRTIIWFVLSLFDRSIETKSRLQFAARSVGAAFRV